MFEYNKIVWMQFTKWAFRHWIKWKVIALNTVKECPRLCQTIEPRPFGFVNGYFTKCKGIS